MLRSTFICVGLLSLLTACSSGGGSGAPATGAGAGAGEPTVVSKAQPLGTFNVEKESALSEWGGIPDDFELTPSLSCNDSETFDPRLRVGDLFEGVQMDSTLKSASSSKMTSEVRAVGPKNLTELITITDPSKTQVRVEGTCQISEDVNNPFTCDFKFLSGQPPADSEAESCESDFGSNRMAKSSGTVALGTYKLVSGQVVKAQRTHRENTNVDIKCGKGSSKVLMGTGKIISDEVTTRELVTREGSLCTPTTSIIRKTVYQLDDGTVLAASNSEVTKAPQR